MVTQTSSGRITKCKWRPHASKAPRTKPSAEGRTPSVSLRPCHVPAHDSISFEVSLTQAWLRKSTSSFAGRVSGHGRGWCGSTTVTDILRKGRTVLQDHASYRNNIGILSLQSIRGLCGTVAGSLWKTVWELSPARAGTVCHLHGSSLCQRLVLGIVQSHR